MMNKCEDKEHHVPDRFNDCEIIAVNLLNSDLILCSLKKVKVQEDNIVIPHTLTWSI